MCNLLRLQIELLTKKNAKSFSLRFTLFLTSWRRNARAKSSSSLTCSFRGGTGVEEDDEEAAAAQRGATGGPAARFAVEGEGVGGAAEIFLGGPQAGRGAVTTGAGKETAD